MQVTIYAHLRPDTLLAGIALLQVRHSPHFRRRPRLVLWPPPCSAAAAARGLCFSQCELSTSCQTFAARPVDPYSTPNTSPSWPLSPSTACDSIAGKTHLRVESVAEELDTERRTGAAWPSAVEAGVPATGAASACEVPFATGAGVLCTAAMWAGCAAAVPGGASAACPAGALSSSTRLRHSGQCVIRSCGQHTILNASTTRVHADSIAGDG
jgi:hypothetical protein